MNLPSLNGNWVDLVIIVFLGFFIFQGIKSGFISVLVDILLFITSFLIGLLLFKPISTILQVNFSLAIGVSNALGFLIASFLSQVLLGYLVGIFIAKIPAKFTKSKLFKPLGAITGFLQGVILISLGLSLFLSLPVLPKIKGDIKNSKLSEPLIFLTSGFDKKIDEIFGNSIDESVNYLIIKPGTRESIPVISKEKNLTVDEKSETQMFELVNKERQKVGAASLIWSPSVVPVARNYARDMWERGYFSHYSPEGKDVGDRLTASNVSFTFAGENLALAPSLATAHKGLMDSQGHKDNILEKKFKKIGIGVIDNGDYGKIFVQVFTD